MTGAGDDREFEDFLARRSPLLRRLSDLDHAEPAAELDRIVVESARRSIGPLGQGPSAAPRRWALPAGLAATVVIATSLALYFGAPGTPAPAPAPASVPATAVTEAIPPATVAVPAMAQKASARARSTAADAAARRDPAEWLAEIRRLRAAGDAAGADRQWQAFRAAWPDYAVPEDASGTLTR